MSNSGRLINYGVRPAKNIERKMMRDMFLRLYPFSSLSDYQYIGFGAKYFIDFHLFHKTLHIDNMISIEGDTNNRKRYNFNKPFDCIDIMFGKSQDVLPKIDFEKKTIIWLDYDSRFNIGMLNDLSTVLSKIISGSFFSLSYNSEVYKRDDLKTKDKDLSKTAYRDKFLEIVGEDNIPSEFDERGWTNKDKFSKFLYDSLISRLKRSLSERNSRLDENEKLEFKQIMYFEYSDGCRMETLGFIVYRKNLENVFQACSFDSLPFYNENNESYKINTPNLTQKEIRFLSEKMPNIDLDGLDSKIFAQKDVENFKEIYKYFPSFNEIEII